MTHRRLNLITFGIMLSLFLASMEGTVVATAMPTIVTQLGGLSIYSWVFSIYMLTSTTTVPIYGKLSDLYGRKRIYIISMVLFVAGSVLCAQAHSMEQLVIFRAVQGLGAGGVLPLSFTIVGQLFTLEQRAKMQGLFSGVWGVSAIIGPLIGGFLVDQISWQWVFLINLIPGTLAVGLVWLAWQDTGAAATVRVKADYLGAALLTLGALCLLWGLSELGNPAGWVFLASSAALLAGLLWVERRAEDPILPLHLFRGRLFNVSMLHGLFSGWAMFGSTAYVPLFVQAVLGTSATQAGIALAPMSLSWTLAGIIGTRLLLKVGYRTLALAGMVMLVAGAFMMSQIGSTSSQAAVMVYTGLMGVGMGLSMPAFLIAVQSVVPKNDLGIATSTLQFSRSIGGTVGVSVLGVFLSSRLAGLLLATGINPAVVSLDSLLDPVAGASLTLEGPLRQALGGAIANMFGIAFVPALLGLLAVLFAPRGKIAELMYDRAVSQLPDGSRLNGLRPSSPEPSPWLDIPAADYEGHMADPSVGQWQLLNSLFKRLLDEIHPQAVAVLGCATGNGFEHFDPAVTETILAIDINPNYLDLARRRFSYLGERLVLKCADLHIDCFENRQFDLIYGGLVFEYLDLPIVLPLIARALKPDGVLAVVLQLPNPGLPSISKTVYIRLESLAPVLRLHAPSAFIQQAHQAGLSGSERETITLPSGKGFYLGLFKRAHS